MMNQNVNHDAERAVVVQGDYNENHDHHHETHHHHHPNDNRQNEFPLGDVEIRRLGFKVTGLNATFAIAGTVYLGSIALNGILSLVQAYCEQVLFKVDHGSYFIHVLTKNAQSKQVLLEQVTSKALEKKLEGIFDKKVEVHLVEVGAVIATEEEFALLKQHMEKKLKKIQFKIDNNCKGTIEDFCCTMPIFQNKSRFLMHKVTPVTEDDIIECLKNNLEFVKPDEESLLQTAHETNNAKFKQQGFLVQHPGFSKFSETFQSHPGSQGKVVEVTDTVEELVKQNLVMIPQVEAEKLLEFNPILFTGNCEMVARKLAKFAKTFMYENDFEITKSLLVWMIKLCNNIMDDERIIRLLSFFLKLIEVFLDFVSESDQHLRGKYYAFELYDATETLCAETNIKVDLLLDMKHYIINMVERSSDRSDFSDRIFRLHCITGSMAKQTGKYVLKLVHYYLKRLLLITRNYDFEKYISYELPIRDLLQVAERLVEFSHSQCVRMVAEVLENTLSNFHFVNHPFLYYFLSPMNQILLSSFNTIHEILESRKNSQCDNSSIFALLITIYKLLLLYNDQSARPLPDTELSSCILRLCYYHTPDNGKLPHELSVAEIFDSESKLLKQVTEKNKVAKKFRCYRNDSSKFDEVHDNLAFSRRNVSQHLRRSRGTLSSNFKGIMSSGEISSGNGSATLSSGEVSSGFESAALSSGYRSAMSSASGYGGEQGTASSLPPPPSLPSTQQIKSSFSERFGGQHKFSPPPPPSPPT